MEPVDYADERWGEIRPDDFGDDDDMPPPGDSTDPDPAVEWERPDYPAPAAPAAELPAQGRPSQTTASNRKVLATAACVGLALCAGGGMCNMLYGAMDTPAPVDEPPAHEQPYQPSDEDESWMLREYLRHKYGVAGETTTAELERRREWDARLAAWNDERDDASERPC